MSRIVVGVDGSSGSKNALIWAVHQAEATGAEVEAVLAYGSDLAWIDVGTEYEERWSEQAARQAAEELRTCIRECVPTSPATIHRTVTEDTPVSALINAAKDADLLVVGSRGRSAFTGFLLGSVSRRCGEHAPCPVVIVPLPDSATEGKQVS